MAPWAAGVRERRQTYEGCQDLHQTPSVLAAASGGGRVLRDRAPPSFGPRQEGLRICFETPEDGQELRENPASAAYPIAAQHVIVRRNMEPVKNQQVISQNSALPRAACPARRWVSRAAPRALRSACA